MGVGSNKFGNLSIEKTIIIYGYHFRQCTLVSGTVLYDIFGLCALPNPKTRQKKVTENYKCRRCALGKAEKCEAQVACSFGWDS